MPATVNLKAVHEYEKWPSTCPDARCDNPDCEHRGEEPWRLARWMDPQSPLTHWSIPRTDTDFDDEDDGEPIVVTLPLVQAARLIVEWPGQVWDHSQVEPSTIDYQYGVKHVCTLFVEGPPEVWQVVAALEAKIARRRAQLTGG